MKGSFVTGIDVGTSSIKAAVAEYRDGKPRLVFAHKEASQGVRHGAIADLAEASQSVNRALLEVKKFSKAALKNLYVSIGTPQVKIQTSRGIVAVSRADAEIYQDDVDRATKASQAVNLGPNRMIIHTITREFIVDGVGDITDPLGLSGNRLEVVSIIIDAFAPHFKSLMRVVELASGEVNGVAWSPLVAAQAALSRAQKELGVALIDIGGGTTSLAVYEENKIVGLAKFPVGAANISNDIAVGLKIPVDVAEQIKLRYGYAVAREISSKDILELRKFVPDVKGAVPRRYIAEIIEARLSEILEFVQNELKLFGKAGKLPGGVVLVGGGAKLPGVTELVKQELKLSSQIGLTLGNFGEAHAFREHVEDPEFVTVLGLILWGAETGGLSGGEVPRARRLKDILSYFMP